MRGASACERNCITRCRGLRARVALLIFEHFYSRSESGCVDTPQGTKVCRYNWHSAGSIGWPFPMLKYKYIFQIKHTQAILSNSTRKRLRFEISRMLIAVLKINLHCESKNTTLYSCL